MADFITIDISSIFNGQNTTNDQNTTTPKDAPASAEQKPEQKKAGTKIDWSKELEKRLDDDKNKTSESRKGAFAVESEFWMDFFKTIWSKDIAKLVDENIGEQLKKDIKILGFKVKSNPILAFLKTTYVQKELISTKLIDSYTYKAIHNALARPYIAKSEFSNVGLLKQEVLDGISDYKPSNIQMERLLTIVKEMDSYTDDYHPQMYEVYENGYNRGSF